MNISEVRIKLMEDPHDRLKAFCSITFESSFVIRDLKIIMGTKGPFVAMPSRKLMDRCPGCHTKNHLRANYCNQCGASLEGERALKSDDGRAKLYADIAHPINSVCRDMIQAEVLKAFEGELVASRGESYRCRYDDYGEENYAKLKHDEEQEDLMAAEFPEFSKREESKEEVVTPTIPISGEPSVHRRLDTVEEVSQTKVVEKEHSHASVSSSKNQSDKNDDFGTGII